MLIFVSSRVQFTVLLAQTELEKQHFSIVWLVQCRQQQVASI